MDIAAFRAAFPPFADAAKYTDASIQAWLDAAHPGISALRWGTYREQGIGLFVAHMLTLTPEAGHGVGGGVPGLVSNKTVGQVSVAYDTLSTSFKDAGHWNQTTYGRQFFYFLRLFGIGGYQL